MILCYFTSSELSASNSVCLIAPRGKASTDSRTRDSHRGKVPTDSQAWNSYRVKVCPESRARNSQRGKVWTDSQAWNSQRGKVPTESQASFTPPEVGLLRIGGRFHPPGYDDLNAKTLIAVPAEIQTESGLPHCIPGKSPNRNSGKVLPPLQRSEPNLRLIILTAICHPPDSRWWKTLFDCSGGWQFWQMAVSFSLFSPVFLLSFEIICYLCTRF